MFVWSRNARLFFISSEAGSLHLRDSIINSSLKLYRFNFPEKQLAPCVSRSDRLVCLAPTQEVKYQLTVK